MKQKLIHALRDYFGDDQRRIDHALAVLNLAERWISQFPGCDEEVVVAVALLHDVGIKPAELQFGYNNATLQEELGPPVARKILHSLGFPEHKIQKVAEIISNHHSPSRYEYPELALLKRADKEVNRREKYL